MEDYGHKKSHPKVTNFSTMVPKAGLEPARISTVDFESTASTDFATSALKGYAETLWIIPVAGRHASSAARKSR